ncbi:hypothetical protein DVH05_023131 [Phytophthora capsici]|nr:hypothetical protein DVH05_023131 [Phytophthora capsici]
MSSTQSATGQVRVVPLPKYDHREGFVSKTRRRALEAEYYKQVRLAQLEVECELEENLHIRAAREAKRLEDTERQERRTDFIINSARSQPFTPRNNDPGEEVVQSTDTTNKEIKDIDKANKVPEKSVSEDPAANALEKESENDGRCGEAMEVQREKKTYEDDQNPDVTDDHCKETDYGGAWNVDPKPHNELEPYQNDSNCKESGLGTIWNMDPVSGNKLDPYRNENNSARDDNSKDTNPGSVWNMDPNPESKSDSHQNESKIADFKDSAEDNDEINVKSAAWNVDPEPSSVEAGEEDPDRAIWNTDPNPGDPISPPDDVPVVYSDDDDDVEAEEEQDNSVSSDVNNESTAWNLPISPSLPTEEKPEDPVVSHEVEADSVKEDSNDDDGNDRKEIWNADPTPAPNERHAATNMTENTDVEHLTEVNQPVWNLNPEPAPVLDAVSSSEEIQHTHDDTNDETSPENAGSTAKEIVHADSNSGEDLNAVAGSPSPKTENTDNPWNLEPQVSTSPDSNTDEGQIPDAGELPDRTENVQLKAVHTDIVSDPDTHTVWNLTPSVPESNLDSDGGNEEDNRNSVWNLDPHTGDSSEPPEVIAVSELQTEVAQEDEDASTPRSVGKQLEDSLTEDPKETLAKSSSNYDEGAEAPAAYPSETSNPNSPSEYEDDATPEYTPPSSARDSDDD